MKMWTIFEIVVLGAIGLISLTEFFIPLLLNKPLFGSFRKLAGTKPAAEKKQPATPGLEDKISGARKKVDEVKKVQEEVDKNFKAAKDLKKESDDLL